MHRRSYRRCAFAAVVPAALVLSATQIVLAQRTTTLRLPHCCAVDSHFDVGAKRFAELVAEYSGGAIQVEVFPGGQLGQETEVIQNVQQGIIELTLIGHDPLAQFAPITTILSLPYLFDDHDQAFALLEGQLGVEIESQLAGRNLVVLGWGNNGARVYTNNRRPLETPADFRGLKFRSPQSPVNLAVTEALGGIAVAIPYGEVYTALQQGTIEGQENAVINIYPANLQEVQSFMSMTHHLLSFTVLVANKGWLDGLPADQRAAVERAALEAMAFQRAHVVTLTDDLVARMEAAGVIVNWPDLGAFREATRAVHDAYVGRSFSQDLYDLIRRAD